MRTARRAVRPVTVDLVSAVGAPRAHAAGAPGEGIFRCRYQEK